VDYVIMDNNNGVFDNNGGSDYVLPLSGAPTEQEVLDRRAAAYEAAERERLAVLPLQHDTKLLALRNTVSSLTILFHVGGVSGCRTLGTPFHLQST
jgi:hypothetical protein